MSNVRITCPHCGFGKDVLSANLPPKEVGVTCPKCKQGFPLSLGWQLPPASPVEPLPAVTAASDIPPPQPDPILTAKPSSVPQGGESARALLLFFVLVVALLVGLRLWADAKKHSVPFPNFIATSAQGVAVSWGQDIYRLDHAGKVVGKQSLPQGAILTQLQFVDNELWVANYAAKAIQRLRNNTLETVVNGEGKFRGTFKFVVDRQKGQIFVTDASNHRVHVYSLDGRQLDSFGSEGKGPGDLKFPNTIVFDRNGDLLIANTNAKRLDVFARDGEFLKSLAQVKAIEHYEYPTLLSQVGERVAFLLTVDLRQAKVVMYGPDGQFLGEFVPPKPIEESGDVAAWGGKVLVSDNKERKIYQFSADSLAYLGPFSEELDFLGTETTRLETRYAKLSHGALIALLISCVPVFFLYLRMRRHERQKIETTDYGAVVPTEAIWGADLNRQNLALGMLALVLALLVLLGGISAKIGPLAPLMKMASMALFMGSFRLVMASGYANPARKGNIEKLVRVAFARLTGILADGEKVEVCTALQSSNNLKHSSLLLLTSRRLLVFNFVALRPIGCSQLGYGDLAALALEPVKHSSGWLSRMLQAERFRLRLLVTENQGATPEFIGQDRQALERIQQYLEEKRSAGEALGYAVLCNNCFRPHGPLECPHCLLEKKHNWKPLVLSLIYPGLGQLCNRELLHGTLISAAFSAGVIMLTIPVTKMLDRSAEFTATDVNFVAQNVICLLLLYLFSIIDADLVGRHGRKLFSTATGKALSAWLRERLTAMGPRRSGLLIELVPGLVHAVAEKYRRMFCLLIPFSFLLWMQAWSLLLIVSGYADAADYMIFTDTSAIVAALWVVITIDGLRQQEPELPPVRITVKGCLMTLGIPCITLLSALLAQFLREQAVAADPAFNQAIRLGFKQLVKMAGRGQGGYSSISASLLFGWGGAIMAMLGTTAWRAKENFAAIIKTALFGFLGGIVCWTLSAVALAGVRGSLSIVPVLFGGVIGLFIFVYRRQAGASPLLVPAVMSGAIVGYVVTVYSPALLRPLQPVLGSGTSRILMVALPAYFIHVAFLVVDTTVREIRGRC